MKRLYGCIIILIFLCGLLPARAFTPVSPIDGNAEFQRPPGGVGEPYHLALGDPEIFRLTLYKVYLVRDDDVEVTLYENPNGITLDLMNAQFIPVSDIDVPPGRYTKIKVILSTTFGVKGYIAFTDHNPPYPCTPPAIGCGQTGYWYTKNGSDQSNIGFSTSIPTSLPDYGTQAATMTDAGEGAELITFEGKPAILYSTDIDLKINMNERPRIRAEFNADEILELNDSTPAYGSDGGSPVQITFEDIPLVTITIL